MQSPTLERLTAWPGLMTDEDKNLAIAFFIAFSRVERAMKRCGIVAGQPKGAAKADWTRLPQRLNGQLESGEVTEALRYLFEHPPKKQVFVADGQEPVWQDDGCSPTDRSPRRALDLVCRVRNNLFHGGKYPDKPVEEPLRDRQLIQCALSVLARTVSICPSLNKHLGEPDDDSTK